MRISAITPSRLAVNPTSEHNNLWLDRALMSVRRQSEFNWSVLRHGADEAAASPNATDEDRAKAASMSVAHEWEFLVGLDANAPWPPERFTDVKFIRSTGAGQARAVNAAAAHATGDVLAFLEDDDYWYPRKMELQLPYLDRYDLVTCNSREIDEHANFIRVNDFAGPSGWVMKRELWTELGGFDESFRWHVDTEFLGRVNAAGKKRMHLVSDGRLPIKDASVVNGNWLWHVSQHSDWATTVEAEPLVGRLVNPAGGMAKIATDHIAATQSREEHERMAARFGEIPW